MPILLHNPTEQELPVPQLGDRDRVDPGAPDRTITGQVIVPAGGSIEITDAESALFAGNSVFQIERTKP